jgi:hypothetical protein
MRHWLGCTDTSGSGSRLEASDEILAGISLEIIVLHTADHSFLDVIHVEAAELCYNCLGD